MVLDLQVVSCLGLEIGLYLTVAFGVILLSLLAIASHSSVESVPWC